MYYPVKEYVSRGAAEGADIIESGGGYQLSGNVAWSLFSLEESVCSVNHI